MDLEGTEVADWLTSKGITCVLLKYRVPFSGPYMDERRGRVYPKAPMALEDAQRTVGLVRFHAAEWHIDPHKIGVLGFSAGGHLVAGISTQFKHRLYPAVDAADKESCRPDFAVALYPGHLWVNEDRKPSPEGDKQFELRPDIHVTRQTPPTFLLQAENDYVDGVNQSLVYYIALKNAEVPVEMHLYAQGGSRVRTAADEVSDHEMARVGGNVAKDDRDDFGVSALGCDRTAQSMRPPSPRSCSGFYDCQRLRP